MSSSAASVLAVETSTAVILPAIRSDSRWGMAHFVCDTGGLSPQLLQEQGGYSSIIF